MQLNAADTASFLTVISAHFPVEIKTIGVAVSGGSDSMAMLHLLSRLAHDNGTRLCVATVDHGLREEAADEAAFVARVSKELGHAHTTLRWQDWDGAGNLQAQARDGRYRLLANWGAEMGCDVICIGHTGTDVAETFVMELSRSAGLDGLSAMDRDFLRHGARFHRPLMAWSREDLREFLVRNDLKWCDDPSNEETKYDRVKVRKALSLLADLGVPETNILASAQNLRDVKQSLRAATLEWATRCVTIEQGDVCIGYDDFAGLDPERKRRIVNASLQWIAPAKYSPRGRAVMDVCAKLNEAKTQTLHGCVLVLSKTKGFRVTREYIGVAECETKTQELWDDRWRLDGPRDNALTVRALGPEGLSKCPDWRDVGSPRISLLSSPSIWHGDELIAAPLAKMNSEWTATLVRGEKQFFSSIVPH